jgi:hypothetical protein
MSDYLRGRISNVPELIKEKGDILSKAVQDIQDGKSNKSFNATLDEIDSDPNVQSLQGDNKEKYFRGMVERIEELHIDVGTTLLKEDFAKMDVAPKNQLVQKCEADPFVAQERLHAGVTKNIALSFMQRDLVNVDPRGEKCLCNYTMASRGAIEKYETRKKASILENQYFKDLCTDAKVFSQLALGTEFLNRDHVQVDVGNCQDLYIKTSKDRDKLIDKESELTTSIEKKSSNGKVSEEDSRAYDQAIKDIDIKKAIDKVAIEDLDTKRQAELFLLQNWNKIDSAAGGISQTGLANYAQALGRAAQAADLSKLPLLDNPTGK